MNKHTPYVMAHRRIYKDRGKASEHTCACGNPVVHWAYQHNAEVELCGPDGRPYSDSPYDYEPMCATFHKRLDDDVKWARIDLELGY